MKSSSVIGALVLVMVLLNVLPVLGGNSTETVISGLDTVWELAWDQENNLYITERSGKVSKWSGNELTTLGTPKAVERGESGLMGMALDPGFQKNSRLYLCYTARRGSGLENVVTRFRLQGDKIKKEEVILDGMRASFIHDGCRLAFGPEDKLLITMGDSSRASLAQNPGSLNGKVLRINTDGSLPADNPYSGSPVYTLGHRNPQGLAVRPGTNQIYISEHGPDTDDEINRLVPGENYGWPTVKGTDEVEGYEPALWDWTPTIAPAGIAFLDSRTLYLATLKESKLHKLSLSEDGKVVEDIVVLSGYGRLRAVTKGPEGNCLYVSTSNKDGRGNPREGDDRVLRYCPTGKG
ncbi:PQQ-dependent sugar dehydrogenase [Candidatus Bipolaricaulota bacterium]|nr:PQQ-dependent sugar dehydrogenase [Candidatus Bipolaricaulota bacterium]